MHHLTHIILNKQNCVSGIKYLHFFFEKESTAPASASERCTQPFIATCSVQRIKCYISNQKATQCLIIKYLHMIGHTCTILTRQTLASWHLVPSLKSLYIPARLSIVEIRCWDCSFSYSHIGWQRLACLPLHDSSFHINHRNVLISNFLPFPFSLGPLGADSSSSQRAYMTQSKQRPIYMWIRQPYLSRYVESIPRDK